MCYFRICKLNVALQGCRDILRMILEKSRILPVEFNVAALEAAEVMNKVTKLRWMHDIWLVTYVPCDGWRLTFECCIYVWTQVVANILNRNACLLPAYLALSEISKLQQLDHAPWPYWVSTPWPWHWSTVRQLFCCSSHRYRMLCLEIGKPASGLYTDFPISRSHGFSAGWVVA